MARGDGRWRVEVLGPLRVQDPAGRDVTPRGVLQCRLLAFLVLRRGRAVSVDAATEALWPRQAPKDPVAALQNHFSRLRRGLPDGVIEWSGSGYRLDPSRIDLDVDRLTDALSAGEHGPEVPEVIDAVLERWTGPAYADLDDVDEARVEAVRLDELRVRAREVRAATSLARGQLDGLVADLRALADEEPLRERPRALLMAALSATGRAAEALRIYDEFRRLIGDELGIEPSPLLAAQHAELLAETGTGAWTPATRLPAPATALVGRAALVEEVMARVEAHRLVTLVGPGGMGKTRLAVEVGLRQRAAPGRPVVLCELAAADPESAVDAVAAALRIDARPGTPLLERIVSVLGDSDALVVLDNCEHVLEPIAELAERLLSGCANLRLLTTSRERLRVPGEQLCAVPPLDSEGAGSAAVRLFVERARAVLPGFDPDPDEAAAVGEIVRRLDGLPLAIELAAARLHTHHLSEVAAGLDQRFALLSTGYRTSARHGSLRAAVLWSYGLLDPRLQEVFAELSVFQGPFAPGDAAAVCGTDQGAVTTALAELAEQSLVTRTADRRYVLLETLRAFGAEQLESGGRAHQLAGRHARHQVEWIERVDRRLSEPGATSLAEIDEAMPELRAAFGWLLDHGHVELAGRMVAALLDYGFFRLRPDVLAWAERVAEADPGDANPGAPLVWVVAAYASWMAGDVPETGARSQRALRVAQRAGGAIPSEVATMCGNVELFEGRLDDAVAWYRRASDAATDDPAQRLTVAGTEILARAYNGDPAAVRLADDLLGEIGDAASAHAAYVWYCAGEADLSVDVERAKARFDRAVELAEATHASFVTGIAGASRATIEARHGDPLVAAADYRWLIRHWRRAGMWSTQWTMLRSIAGLLWRLGRPREAAVLVGAVRATEAGHRIFGADEAALNDLGARLRAELGDEGYEAALEDGAALDGDAAVEHAVRSL